MKYSKYPNYRNSGVEWLGEIPEHWRNSYLKYIAKINMGQSPSSNTYNTEGIGIEFLQGNADFGKLYPTARTFTTEAKKMSLVEDILFTVRAPVGAMNLSDKAYAIGRGLCAISSTVNSEKSFLWWLMPVVKMELDTVATGSTYEAVSVEQVSNSVVSLPPLQEQQTIANYLDKATAKIDTLIAKQTRLIELLKEKRQAVISTAVTRGLDSTVPMKDSGVEWLGEIPEGWTSSPLKFLLQEPLMYGANEAADRNNPNDPRYIRITDIKTDGSLHNDTFRSLPMEIASPYLLKNNSLLLARSGATVGKTFLYDESWGIACFAGYLIKATMLATKANAKFVSYFTKTTSYWQWLNSSQIQATIENVSAEKYANLDIPLPPISEQEAIVEYMDEKTSKIDTLITKATKAIDLLKEKRTALISAAVTGKIDVRNAS